MGAEIERTQLTGVGRAIYAGPMTRTTWTCALARAATLNALLTLVAPVFVVAASGCDEEPEDKTCTGARLPGHPQLLFGGDRPVEIRVPEQYDPTCPTPLLLILHGHGMNGAIQDIYFNAERLVEEEGVIVAAPDGTLDDNGEHFWNGESAACCSFFNESVDDVAYLEGLMDEIGEVYNIDPDRIYVLGHSNGAMMAYRLACDMGERLAGIVSLAGFSEWDLGACGPAKTSVLHLHGTDDDTVLYAGGDNLLGDGGPAYPGTAESTALWAAYNGCSDTGTPAGSFDLDGGLAGEETQITVYEGCPGALRTELWSIQGAGHVPSITSKGLPSIWAWLAPLCRTPVSD